MTEIIESIKNLSYNLNLNTIRCDESVVKTKAHRTIGTINHIVTNAIKDLEELRDLEIRFITDVYKLEEDD